MIELNVPFHKLVEHDGYGRYTKALMRALLARGDFDLRPLFAETFDWETWIQQAAGVDSSRLTLYIAPGHEVRSTPLRTWLLTMYESTRIPDGWAANINAQCERIIVPCEWLAGVFEANGVKTPIHVVHGGTDMEECALLPDIPRRGRPYTFMALADRGFRKGYDIAYMAFYEAFRADDNVQLIFKSRTGQLTELIPRDLPRQGISSKIRLWVGEIDRVRDIYAYADCFVFPSKAEGWGMPCREAAACGLPVLATNYSGMAVDCEQWAIPLNHYRIVDSVSLPTPFAPGKWAQVDYKEVAHWMRWCYEHPEEAKDKGLQSAAWLRANQTWAHSAQALHDLITEMDVTRPQQAQAEWEWQNQQSDDHLNQFVEQLQHRESPNGKNR